MADDKQTTTGFDPDEFMKSRGSAAVADFDPDEFMQQRGKASAATTSTATKTEQPGFFKRLGQSLGLPTSKEEMAQPKQSFTESAISHLPLTGVYNWGKRAVKNIGEGLGEEGEAVRNIKEGGPVIPNIGKAAYGIVHGGVGSIPFVGEPIETAGQDIANENYAGAAGGLTGVVGQVAAPELAEHGPRVIKSLPAKTALALRTEEGGLKPIVHAGSRVAGALAAHAAGIPGFEGYILGGLAGPSVAERLIPNLPTDIPVKPGTTSGILPSIEEFYENRATDLAKRGKEQAAIDKTAAREAKANPPFETPGSAPATLPSAEEFYEHRGMDLLRRGAQEEALAKKQAAAGGGIPKIVSPTEGEPRITGSEGRPATWTNEFVLDQAAKGNRDAISQAVRRGLELPANARYIMGDPDFPRAVLNPKEVTLFSPEGIPIRNKANAQAEAQPGTIPTISRTPRGRIPNIGEGEAPQGAPLPFPGPLPETPAGIAAKPPAEAAAEPVAAAPEKSVAETPARTKEETNAIRTELSEYNQKAKKWGDKIASARPSSWRAQREWMENLEAADKRVAELKDALEKGTPIKLGPRGATKAELTSTYRSLEPEQKAEVDELLKEHSILDAQGRERFAYEHGLGNSAWKGLPLQEKLARKVTGAKSGYDAMDFIRSLRETPEAAPAEPTQQAKPTPAGIQNIGQPSTGFKIPARHQMIAETPPVLEPVLKESGWRYTGKNTLGVHTIEEPGTNIKIQLFDRDMNPDFVRRKIAQKEKQFGTPKNAPKAKETGEEEVPF